MACTTTTVTISELAIAKSPILRANANPKVPIIVRVETSEIFIISSGLSIFILGRPCFPPKMRATDKAMIPMTDSQK